MMDKGTHIDSAIDVINWVSQPSGPADWPILKLISLSKTDWEEILKVSIQEVSRLTVL